MFPDRNELKATIAAVDPAPATGIIISCPDFFFIHWSVLNLIDLYLLSPLPKNSSWNKYQSFKTAPGPGQNVTFYFNKFSIRIYFI